MKIDLAILVCDEPDSVIHRCLRLAVTAFPRVAKIWVCRRQDRALPDIGHSLNVFDGDNSHHLFSSYRDVFHRFIEHSDADFLAVLDPDTLVLRHDAAPYDVSGLLVRYMPKLIRKWYDNSPEKWRDAHRDVPHIGCLHSLQGHFWWLSRRTVSLVLSQIPDDTFPLIMEDNTITGSEMFFGIYLRKARFQARESEPLSERVCFYANEERLHYDGNIEQAVARAHEIFTLHPVKNREEWLRVLEALPGEIRSDLLHRIGDN